MPCPFVVLVASPVSGRLLVRSVRTICFRHVTETSGGEIILLRHQAQSGSLTAHKERERDVVTGQNWHDCFQIN